MAHDSVNHPSHYRSAARCENCGHPIECIVVAEQLPFNIGSAFKYLWRAGRKTGEPILRDLEKARWFVERQIAKLTKEKAPRR